MLKMLFRGLLITSSTYYGDSIGLAPISFAKSKAKNNDFWSKTCKDNPSSLSCLKYDC